VRQRIADGLDDGLVELDVVALGDEAHLLAELPREIPHHPRKLAEDVAHRLHAGLHDRLLELARDLVDPRTDGVETACLPAAEALEQLVAAEHQLTGEVHQVVQDTDGDPDRGRAR